MNSSYSEEIFYNKNFLGNISFQDTKFPGVIPENFCSVWFWKMEARYPLIGVSTSRIPSSVTHSSISMIGTFAKRRCGYDKDENEDKSSALIDPGYFTRSKVKMEFNDVNTFYFTNIDPLL